MDTEIEVYEHIAGTPAEKLAIRGMYEATQAGHLHAIHVTPEIEAIVASVDGEAVAFVTFEEYEECGEFWLIFGYCLPEHRRKGPYRACIAELRDIAADRGYSIINTAVHPTNDAARASIEARGGTVRYINYVFPVAED